MREMGCIGYKNSFDMVATAEIAGGCREEAAWNYYIMARIDRLQQKCFVDVF